jgi:hypothetical protein
MSPLRRPLVWLLALVLVAGLAGCQSIPMITELESAVNSAGVELLDHDVSETSQGEQLTVVYESTLEGDDELAAQTDRVAEAIWTRAPIRFEVLTLSRGTGGAPAVFTRDELTEQFGPRPPGLDKSMSDAYAKDGLAFLLFIVGGFVIFALIVIAIIVAVVRSRGRHRRSLELAAATAVAQPWGSPYGSSYGSPYGQQPYGSPYGGYRYGPRW